MSFDKVKAMRNAERFLAQGKLRAAISEYKRVVEFDKTDFNTLNMLGDLYVKAAEQDEAVNCFTQVAEHYGKQGFAQKAIAIYNKISRLKPDLIEVSAKLAQLYQMKGSVAEARTHYTTVAEQYVRNGRKAEALHVWKQIANLDPGNTDIYLKIADACWQDQQKEEAANAYIEAGNRLTNKSQFESAITAFSRALEIRPDDLPALRGFAKSQIGLGFAEEAAKLLESSHSRQPNSREIVYLLSDCYIEAGKLIDAENTIVKLVEQEPTNYPKLLEIFQAYIKTKNINSATRILSMVSEHMLVGGRAIELEQKINEVLDQDPDDLDAIRLLVRFHSWQRDEGGIKSSFERLAEAARVNEAVEDEIYALSQLVMIAPQNVYFAKRLQELSLAGKTTFSPQSQISNNRNTEIPTFESFKVLSDEDHYAETEEEVTEYEGETHLYESDETSNLQENSFEIIHENENVQAENENSIEQFKVLTEFEKHGFQTEIEGIDFYIEQGFFDLAEKTLDEIENRFGNQPEIIGLRHLIDEKLSRAEDKELYENSQKNENEQHDDLNDSEFSEQIGEAEEINNAEIEELESAQETVEEINSPELENNEEREVYESENSNETETIESEFEQTVESFEETTLEDQTEEFVNEESLSEEFESYETEQIESEKYEAGEFETGDETHTSFAVDDKIEVPIVENTAVEQNFSEAAPKTQQAQLSPLQELQSELNEEEMNSKQSFVENNANDDAFETSYQTGIVYREMGLIEDSIREFQDAIKLVTPHDGTRKFFLCCNMLGHCFMEKGMPNIAIMWFKKGLDSNHLTQSELNGMKYELAFAYEQGGDKQKAREHYEEIYAVDVDFRDVGKRLQNLISGQ